MANAHSTVIGGISFGSDEVFGPSVLGAMFGPSLPSAFKRDETGAVPVHEVASYLKALGESAIAWMTDNSEIITPFTPSALAPF